MSKNLIKSDAMYQAEWDADTMARYEEIMSSPSRKKAAMAAARKKVREMEQGIDRYKKATKRK